MYYFFMALVYIKSMSTPRYVEREIYVCKTHMYEIHVRFGGPTYTYVFWCRLDVRDVKKSLLLIVTLLMLNLGFESKIKKLNK
jgi:hypothetical protein